MSRYVDLDGLTWDGNTISSKIQEVETRHGFMSAITIGWLYGDNVPHIDLEKYEAEIRADEKRKFAEWLTDTCSVWSEDYPFGMNAKTLIYEYERSRNENKANL